MQKFKLTSTLRLIAFMVTAVGAIAPIRPSIAQEPDQNLASRLSELKDKVASLEAALNKQSGGAQNGKTADSGGQAMSGTEMSMGGMDKGMSGGSGGMGMMEKMEMQIKMMEMTQ